MNQPRTLDDVLAEVRAGVTTETPKLTIVNVYKDAELAYKTLGQVEYLKAHPKFFEKLLKQMLYEMPSKPLPASFLKEDVLQAYHELGGATYLASKPWLLEAILFRQYTKR